MAARRHWWDRSWLSTYILSKMGTPLVVNFGWSSDAIPELQLYDSSPLLPEVRTLYCPTQLSGEWRLTLTVQIEFVLRLPLPFTLAVNSCVCSLPRRYIQFVIIESWQWPQTDDAYGITATMMMNDSWLTNATLT